jgi:hypothetical protein
MIRLCGAGNGHLVIEDGGRNVAAVRAITTAADGRIKGFHKALCKVGMAGYQQTINRRIGCNMTEAETGPER